MLYQYNKTSKIYAIFSEFWVQPNNEIQLKKIMKKALKKNSFTSPAATLLRNLIQFVLYFNLRESDKRKKNDAMKMKNKNKTEKRTQTNQINNNVYYV